MPLLDAFFMMMWFFLWILWFFLLFRVILDIFRSRDLGGWGKAGWLAFVIILPFLGVFVYLIARGHKMAERDAAQAQAQDEAFRSHVQETAQRERHRRRAHEAGWPARPRGNQRGRIPAGQGQDPRTSSLTCAQVGKAAPG